MKYLDNVISINVNLEDLEIQHEDVTKPVIYLVDGEVINIEYASELTADQIEVLAELEEHDKAIEAFLRDKGLAA